MNGRKKINKSSLKNKPLLEAIFEIKWNYKKKTLDENPMKNFDPNYKLLIGTLYDKIKSKYEYHESLPTSEIPDMLISGIVQHRFRVEKDKWPLVQVGPGVLTINDTENYSWKDFKEGILFVTKSFYDVYPEKDKIVIKNLTLRYINAMEFDFKKDDIFKFLKDKMKTNIELRPSLFEVNCIEKSPKAFDWRFSYSCKKPKSILTLRFFKGERSDGTTGLLWEMIVQSVDKEVPKIPEKMREWLEGSHDIIEDWFFKLIEGDLQRGFE